MKLNRTESPLSRAERNKINGNWQVIEEVLNQQGRSIQDLVAEGQLTEEQYANLINKVNDASPKGAYATLTDLQNAYPEGADGIYVVTANGNWYYYDGATWQAGGVYQSTQWQDALTTHNQDWVI